jgi:hypothetical protein
MYLVSLLNHLSASVLCFSFYSLIHTRSSIHLQVIHVLDASKAVTVVSTLMDASEKDAYCEDIKEEYVAVLLSSLPLAKPCLTDQLAPTLTPSCHPFLTDQLGVDGCHL